MDDPQKKTKDRARRKAVALGYDSAKEEAPTILAKGSGLLADRIIALALEHDIHIYEDPDLVAVLAKLDVRTPIPPDLYKAIAEILAFVYRLNERFPEKRP